jgi:hypothetical protein
MAGEWISIDCNIEQKPKFARVVMATGEPADLVLARMVRLWLWVQLNAVDGVADGNLEVLAHIHGGAPEFWQAVADAGWLELDPDGLTIRIPDWDERFSQAAKQRKQSARRMAKMRGNSAGNVTQHRNGVTQERNSVTQQRNRCVTRRDETRRDEKRGEEKRNDEPPIGGSSSDGFATAPALPAAPVLGDTPERPPEAAREPKKARRVYRVNWTPETGFTGILEADREMWKKAFPAVDLELAFSQMNSWLISNPAKAKKSNWNLFIHRWLTREQDRGGNLKSNPVSRFQSPEERRNTQSIKDAEARDRFNYSWRPDARKMMGEAEYQEWRAGYEREMKRRRAEQAKANGLAQGLAAKLKIVDE